MDKKVLELAKASFSTYDGINIEKFKRLKRSNMHLGLSQHKFSVNKGMCLN
jgi:hypothetical protein